MQTLVIIGGGLAGSSCARAYVETARRAGAGLAETEGDGPAPTEVVLIDPREAPCELPPLSKTLFAAELSQVPFAVPEAVRRVQGTVTGIEPSGCVVLADGQRISFDGLVVATGLRARRPQTPLPGGPVHTIRTAADAEAIRAAAAATAGECEPQRSDIGVLGSGYLALETARGAADAGHRVTVYLRADRPLIGRHHASIARTLMDRHAAAGVQFVLDADPSDYAAHALWIAAIGAVPDTGMLPGDWDRTASGGLCVDDELRVQAGGQPLDGVWAIGDLAHVEGVSHEAEATAAAQGEWLGARLAGSSRAASESPGARTPLAPPASGPAAHFSHVPWHWSFQGPERVFSAGWTGDRHPVISGDPASGRFQVLHFAPAPGPHAHAGADAAADVLAGVETLNQPPAHNAARTLLGMDPQQRPRRADAAGEPLDLRAWVRRHRS